MTEEEEKAIEIVKNIEFNKNIFMHESLAIAKVLSIIKKQQKKLEKKDKIIDLMAEDLMVCDGGLTFIDIGTSNGNFKEDKEKMIRHYEKKVEENDYEK